MLIDCDTCSARGRHCGDCVVSAFLAARPLPLVPPRSPSGVGAEAAVPVSPPGTRVELDAAEQAAVAELMRAGLVPPLRLVTPLESREYGCETDIA